MAESIFILAGEPSGDELAGRMMGAINAAYGQQNWVGVGGSSMQAQGLTSWAEMEQLAIIGFGAALKAYGRLSKLMDDIIDQIMAERPRAVLTVDAKGFSLRLAARLRRRMSQQGWHAPIIHTVAPTVWAWGAWRRHRVAKQVDRLLCLFPFEPEYFSPLGLDTRFIGHPEAFNPSLEIQTDPKPSIDKHIVLLPGSRRSELKHNFPTMLAALAPVRAQHPQIRVSLVTIARLQAQIAEMLDASGVTDVEVIVGQDSLVSTVSGADAVMAVSGTVTLQTALLGAPGVTLYKADAISAWIGRRLVAMEKVILPNAILGYKYYPFLFQEQATAKRLSLAMIACLEDAQAKETASLGAQELRRLLKNNATSFDKLVASAFSDIF